MKFKKGDTVRIIKELWSPNFLGKVGIIEKTDDTVVPFFVMCGTKGCWLDENCIEHTTADADVMEKWLNDI